MGAFRSFQALIQRVLGPAPHAGPAREREIREMRLSGLKENPQDL